MLSFAKTAPATATWQWVLLIASFLICATVSFQYIRQTSFPMGGDPVRYVTRAELAQEGFSISLREGFTRIARNSAYPPVIALLAATKLPWFSWPSLFTWWMVIAHTAAGGALLLFLYRFSGWQAASVGVLLWGMTATLNHHFENGILAHLLSLTPLLLFFHELLRKSSIGMILAVIATAGLHFMSGLFLLIILLMLMIAYAPFTSPLISDKQRKLLRMLSIAFGIAGFFGLSFLVRSNVFNHEFPIDKHTVPWMLFTSTALAPFFPLVPIGAGALAWSLHRRTLGAVAMLFFAATSILLTFNNLLGVSLQVRRFESYYLLTLIILASLAVPFIIQSLKVQSYKYFVGFLLVGLLATQTVVAWQQDVKVYTHHELPNGARVHPDALVAIEWIGSNLPPESLVTSTLVNRHTEWIIPLTEIRWLGLYPPGEFENASGAELDTIIREKGYTHLIILKERESLEEVFRGSLDQYPVVFENEEAMIIQLQ
ncbi:MAG: hypothetical protein WEC84_01220 [Candidatus Andersenbacteria bacterium]